MVQGREVKILNLQMNLYKMQIGSMLCLKITKLTSEEM